MAITGIDAYRTVRTTTADPLTLTSMLFEGAVKAMNRAEMLHAQGNLQAFRDENDRAMLIVGELLATLDMEQGDLPKQLGAVYAYCLRALVDAGRGRMDRLGEARRCIETIGLAWKTATAQLRDRPVELAETVA